jgi:hypothetical protein
LKRLYRGISALETRILKDDADENAHDNGRIVMQGRGKERSDENHEIQRWNEPGEADAACEVKETSVGRNFLKLSTYYVSLCFP